jgi:hypothetical protein
MKRLLFTSLLLTTATTFAVPTLVPPERHVHVTSIGDVLEWQPGLGIVVVRMGRTQSVTRHARRSSDGKSVVEVEHSTRVRRAPDIEHPFTTDKPRAEKRVNDEGESLMEEVEKGEVIP